jgi:prepilin-type N-terminal cleavage/methylation domain-containing protein
MLQTTRHRAQDGFSLVEVMIATVILATGMLAIALAQVSALKMGSRSKHLTEAMYLAQEQIETFQAMPSTDPTFTQAGTVDDPDGYVMGGGHSAEGEPMTESDGHSTDTTRYLRSWTVEPNTPSVGLTRITIEVEWQTPDSNTGSTEVVWIKGASS